jgi:hypothetical protein
MRRVSPAACLTVLVAASIAGAQPPPPLTFGQLQNLVLQLDDNSSVEGGKVPLQGGRWSDASPDGGSTFTLLPLHAIGDLDGDGAADAAVILLESTTGTGSFYYLFAVKNASGRPEQLGPPEWLGDRVDVERLAIDRKGVLTIRCVTHKDGDPACCPTLRIQDRFRIEHGRLQGITR